MPATNRKDVRADEFLTANDEIDSARMSAAQVGDCGSREYFDEV